MTSTKVPHVTFGSLDDGKYFFARGKFHCKGIEGIFQLPPDRVVRNYNAFYFDGSIGKWALFDDLTLVQRYDEKIHGQPAGIINLRDRVHF